MRKPQRKTSKVSNVLVAVEQAPYFESRAANQNPRVIFKARKSGLKRARFSGSYRGRNIARHFYEQKTLNIGDKVLIYSEHLKPDIRSTLIKYIEENLDEFNDKRRELVVSTNGERVFKVEILEANLIADEKSVDNEVALSEDNYNRFDDLRKISLNDIKKHISMVRYSDSQLGKSGNKQMTENGFWALEQTEKGEAISNWNNFQEFEMTGKDPISLDDKEKEALDNFKTLSKDNRRAEILRLLTIIQSPKIT